MANFAPPVRHGTFLFTFVLYADVGSNNHHPRATVDELTQLLRPDAPKSKKKSLSAQAPETFLKDKPAHWYTAQLMHYGLQQTKDKNTAKVRILDALNRGQLAVPTSIVGMRADMKKQWEAENRKLRKVANKPATLSSTDQGATPSGSSIKRKRDDEELTTMVNQNKKAKAKKPAASTTSTAPTPSQVASSAPKETRPKTKKSAASTHSAAQTPTQASVSAPKETKPKPAKENGKGASKKTIIPYYGGYAFERLSPEERKTWQGPKMGAWGISCPQVENEWTGDTVNECFLTFSPSKNESVMDWWSPFDWGNFSGILVLRDVPSKPPIRSDVLLEWRARYKKQKKLVAGFGSVRFTSRTTLQGDLPDFFKLGKCTFQGKHRDTAVRSPAPGLPPLTPVTTPILHNLKSEWERMEKSLPKAKKPKVKKEPDDQSQPQSSSQKPRVKQEPHVEQEPRIKPEPSSNFSSHNSFQSQANGTNSFTINTSDNYNAHDNEDTYYNSHHSDPMDIDSDNYAAEADTDYPVHITFSGPYTTTSPSISIHFSHAPATPLGLIILRDRERGVWWARFTWYAWDCTIMMRPGPDGSSLNRPCTLGWRLHDTRTGQRCFGRGCTGQMTFFEDRRVHARLVNLPHVGDVEFWCERVSANGSGSCNWTADELQDQWEEFIQETYRR